MFYSLDQFSNLFTCSHDILWMFLYKWIQQFEHQFKLSFKNMKTQTLVTFDVAFISVFTSHLVRPYLEAPYWCGKVVVEIIEHLEYCETWIWPCELHNCTIYTLYFWKHGLYQHHKKLVNNLGYPKYVSPSSMHYWI